MPRIFIALNLPNKIKAEFKKIQADLKQKNNNQHINWVNPQIAHINLHFLGDLDKKALNNLKENLSVLEGKYGPISVALTGVGAFPGLKNPHILFLGIKHTGPNNLIKLYQNIGKILGELNLPIKERPFIAHLTLGRIKDAQPHIKFTGEEMPDIEFKINSFELMSSELKPDGAEYRIIKSYRL